MGSADRKQTNETATEVEAELAEPGFPVFEHNQWTVEGEIERFGAFGRAGARAQGWKRAVAILLVIAFVGPLIVTLGIWIYALLT